MNDSQLINFYMVKDYISILFNFNLKVYYY